MFLVSPCGCLCPIHWSKVLSREWRCSWSSADRRCSNYIWVINNFIAYYGVTYIRGFTVSILATPHELQRFNFQIRAISYPWTFPTIQDRLYTILRLGERPYGLIRKYHAFFNALFIRFISAQTTGRVSKNNTRRYAIPTGDGDQMSATTTLNTTLFLANDI